MIVGRIDKAMGVTEPQPGVILSFIHDIGSEFLPIVALVMIFIVAIIFHLTVRIWISFVQILNKGGGYTVKGYTLNDAYLGGSVGDSINASFAFAAFFIPLATTSYSLLFLLATWLPNLNWVIALIIVLALTLSLTVSAVYYFVASLSAIHPNTSFWEAFGALAGAIMVIYYTVRGVAYLVSFV